MSLKAALTLILPPCLLFCGTAHGQTAAVPTKASLQVPAKPAAAMSDNAAIQGPVATGGGLYPVKNGRPVSFAEAGYVFKLVESKVLKPEFQRYYQITPETKKALRQVLSELPPVFELERAVDKIVGDRTAFIWQDQVDQKVLNEIQVVYSTVVASFGQTVDPSATVLAAYSKGDKTYILPPFRDDDGGDAQPIPHLNDEQRALNLIHEFKMRGNDLNQSKQEAQARLKLALQLDDLIYSYRHGKKTAIDQLEFARDFGKLAPELAHWDGVNQVKNSAIARLIGEIEKQLGRPLLFSEIVGRPWEVRGYSDRFGTDPNLVHDFDSVIPNLSQLLPRYGMYTASPKLIGETVYLQADRWVSGISYPTAFLSEKIEAVARRAKNSQRAEKIMAELCQQHQGLFAAADVKANRLMHYDEQFDRVLISNCEEQLAFLWVE